MGGRAALVACAAVVAASCAQPVVDTTPGASAPAPTYALDPTHTFVHWEVLHTGTSTLRGRFDRSIGSVQFDAKAQRLDVNVTVDTASVSSGVPVLDALLRSSSTMLATAANPQATFIAHAARFEGELPREVQGELTLRGVTQPLTLRALRWNCALNLLFRREVCGGDFEAFIDRSSFGVTHSLLFVADRMRLVIQVEGIRQ